MLIFARPKALEHALELLSQDSWTILAGGTDFYPALRGEVPGTPVLDITAVSDLSEITVTDSGDYRIGALVTWSTIARAKLPPAFLSLQQSALEIGSQQIQNRATLAGNLCNASPAADGVPPLLCLDASVELVSHRGVRQIPLTDFIHGNRRTARDSDELLSAIIIPSEAVQGISLFNKLGTRRFLVISIAMVAARIEIADRRIDKLAVAIGSCSVVARRLHTIETMLVGQSIDDHPEALITPDHLHELEPIDDIRATAHYRQQVALQLVKRSLTTTITASSSDNSGVL